MREKVQMWGRETDGEPHSGPAVSKYANCLSSGGAELQSCVVSAPLLLSG